MHKIVFCFFFLPILLFSQENITYQKPPKEILELADFERAPSVNLNSKKTMILLSYRNTYKTLDELNQPEMKLGGLRINPNTNISSTISYINNLKIRNLNSKTEIQVKGLPEIPKISYLNWSPDEKWIAFCHTENFGVSLWILNVENATAKKISKDYLNANLGRPFEWHPSSQYLLICSMNKNRNPLIDGSKSLPDGPIVSSSDGKISQNRTYQDLLKNKTDESNFEQLVTSSIQKITIEGAITPFLPEAMYTGFDYSPDGNYLLVNNIEKPFSYIVPMNRFPSAYNIYDNNAQFVKLIHKNPLLEIIPKGFSATIKGKRAIQWRDDKAATLFFVEALDEGDPAKEAPFRDALYRWEAPFNNEPNLFFKTKWRFSDIQWTNANFAMVIESWYDTRMSTTFKINPDTIQQEGFIFDSRNYQDVYSDPGNFYTVKNEFNKNVAGVVKNKMFLIGDGYTKEGQFPFIDEYDPNLNTKKRIYTFKSKNQKEEIVDFFDVASKRILVRLESKNEYPNYFFKDIKSQAIQAITNFKNPFLKLNNVYKEVIKYNRKDGVELSGTFYLPEGYDRKSKKQKLPLLIWAYPREFKDKNTAGQVTSNPNAFTFPYYGSFVYWVTKGYAILDNASFPILGEGKKEPNDFFIEQLIDNAHAAIQAVNQLGYIDTQKVAIGGHSYGAFMTANLLTHTNLFKCGIARSGAYNRTLTPFGFQSEQRNYWDIPDVYNKMSPFMNANKMKTPLLLTHGEADNNPGTFTLQTERYFQALKGLGAPVRMVILPKESHGYLAKENILHLLWEQDQFLEKYLK